MIITREKREEKEEEKTNRPNRHARARASDNSALDPISSGFVLGGAETPYIPSAPICSSAGTTREERDPSAGISEPVRSTGGDRGTAGGPELSAHPLLVQHTLRGGRGMGRWGRAKGEEGVEEEEEERVEEQGEREDGERASERASERAGEREKGRGAQGRGGRGEAERRGEAVRGTRRR